MRHQQIFVIILVIHYFIQNNSHNSFRSYTVTVLNRELQSVIFGAHELDEFEEQNTSNFENLLNP